MNSLIEHEKNELLLPEISAMIKKTRAEIMDPVEQAVGGSPQWPFLRGRLLKALGPRGLEGKILEIVGGGRQ